MVIVIFRTCREHDYICRLSYESYKRAGVGDRFVFLCQKGHEFKHLAGLDADYTYHEADGNFGGQLSVKAFWDALRRVDGIQADDTVFISDSDILIRQSPMAEINNCEWDHRGMMCSYPHLKYFLHSSGQCQILKGWVVDKLRSQTNRYVDNVWQNEMVPENICVSDDTFLSWETEKMGIRKVPMPVDHPYWYHWKFGAMQEKFSTDYEAAINFILANPEEALKVNVA
jgi:hypothetical protein